MDTYTESRKANARRILAEAGGNIERAVSILFHENEGYDGETQIALSCEIRLREDLGFDATDARRRLKEAAAEEEAWMKAHGYA